MYDWVQVHRSPRENKILHTQTEPTASLRLCSQRMPHSRTSIVTCNVQLPSALACVRMAILWRCERNRAVPGVRSCRARRVVVQRPTFNVQRSRFIYSPSASPGVLQRRSRNQMLSVSAWFLVPVSQPASDSRQGPMPNRYLIPGPRTDLSSILESL